MRRMMRYSNTGAVLGEVSPNDVFECLRREEINGEHSLEITTIQRFSKNERIVMQDARGYWHEYVIVGVDDEHSSGNTVVGTYYAVWSVQAELMGINVSAMPGTQTPVTAATALDAILDGQTRWTRGTVTNTNTGGASMYDMDAWKAMGVLVENWGGEVDTTITVDVNAGVATRAICLYSQMGQQSAKRRYDFGADLLSVKRKYDDSPLYCRISPRGKGEQTEGGGYGRKIRITSVNSGKDYLEYAPMVDVAKVKDGSSWIYPTLIVENSDCETPQELKDWALTILEDACTPNVTYEVDALQAGLEGVSVQGVSLGDVVHIVDRYFGAGLRLEGRITAIEFDEVNEREVTIKIGYIGGTFADRFSKLETATVKATESVQELANTLATSAYINSLIDRINTEINATGGYTYIVEGNGILTYDTAVSDPLVGAEASKVVEIKGGSVRIANSKTAQGAWEWKTVFTSGHVAADLVTAANIVAGYIGSAASGNYWDLDNGYLTVSNGEINAGTIHGGTLTLGGSNNVNGLMQVYDASGNLITTLDRTGITVDGGKFVLRDVDHTTSQSGITGTTRFGMEQLSIYDASLLMKGWGLSLKETYTGTSAPTAAEFYMMQYRGQTHLRARNHLEIAAQNSITSSSNKNVSIELDATQTEPFITVDMQYNSNKRSDIDISPSGVVISSQQTYSGPNTRINVSNTSITFECVPASTNYSHSAIKMGSSTINVVLNTGAGNENAITLNTASLTVRRDFTVGSSYSKSKVVDTEDYATRKLYCYETASPMFADIGSGVIGSDGVCVVAIDDIFAETVRTDIAYQVFLQKCGEGDLWVEHKGMAWFIVRGTPGLSFDWELKAKQAGWETTRLENEDLEQWNGDEFIRDVGVPTDVYADELNFVGQMEAMLNEAA